MADMIDTSDANITRNMAIAGICTHYCAGDLSYEAALSQLSRYGIGTKEAFRLLDKALDAEQD